MSEKNQNQKATGTASPRGTRYAILALVAVALFALSYTVASARGGSNATSTSAAGSVLAVAGSSATGSSGGSAGAAGAACACCGSGSASSTPIERTAVVENGVQRIDVDLSSGSYDPNTIVLKAGVPAEITFGQSNGCTAQVQSQDLGFFEDLTSGPKTVKLAALTAGEYQFSCGMQMVFGKVVVQ